MIDKLILGTAQLGMNYGVNNYGKLSKDNVFDILEFAYNNNITILDTAEIYGEALTLIGLFLKANPKKHFKIISKLSLENRLQKKDIFQHLESNLKILNTEYYHGYMIHNFKDLKKYPEIYEQLKNAKTRGYINNIGISLYEEYEIIDILENYHFDFIQVPFNLLDNEKSKRDILKRAKNKKIDIHARSIFLQGLFFTPEHKFSEQLKPLNKYIKKIIKIAKANRTDLETLAIQYPIKKDYIDKIIIGVHNLNQFDKNIKILKSDIYIPEDEIERIDIEEKELLKPYNWH